MIQIIKSIITDSQFWAIIIPAFMAILIFLKTKESEREAEWRKEKLKIYLNFMEALSCITDCEKSENGDIAFAKACNDLHLLSPMIVLNALHTYQKEMSIKNINATPETRNRTQEDLIYEIRKDLKLKPKEHKDDFNLLLWTSGVNNKKDL